MSIMSNNEHAPRYAVPRSTVDELVGGFLESEDGRAGRFCTGFAPDQLRVALRDLPDSQALVDFDVVSAAVEEFACRKLTANCDTWTRWMRSRLREARISVRGPTHEGETPGV